LTESSSSTTDRWPGDTLRATGVSRAFEALHALREVTLDEPTLRRTGTHPGLGRVTLAQLLAAWVVHDLGHVKQVARTMAGQYREAVGPWREYLTILDRP